MAFHEIDPNLFFKNEPIDGFYYNDPSPPYSLRVKAAADHFGIKAQTLYQWINDGRLIRGKHYLKIGKVVCIIREAFIEYMREVDRNGR